jgi:hypothetical protein
MFRTLFASIALAMGLVLSAPAFAEKIEVPTAGKPLVIDVPDSWDTEEVARGIQLSTEDEEVFLWIEAYAAPDFEAVKKELVAYLVEQGIEIKGEPTISTHDAPKHGIAALDFPATWNGGPTILRYLIIEPKNPAKSRLIISYWATPEGDKKYDAETQRIIDSFGAALDAD